MTPLRDILEAEIDAHGPLSLARFMEQALYHPEHGYYTQGPARAGVEWTTAPTLHPIFAKTLAKGLAPVLDQVDDPQLVEVGAGNGELMRDLAYALADQAPHVFQRLELVVVERSEPSLQRALSTLEAAGIVLDDVTAASQLPSGIQGVVVSNELLDAMPVDQCQVTEDGSIVERRVATGPHGLTWTTTPVEEPGLRRLAEAILVEHDPGVIFEVPQVALEGYQAACEHLDQGAVVTIDYGATAQAIQAAIPEGTVHGYRQGKPTTDVLRAPGEIDLTYLVPFDHVAQAGEMGGLSTEAYATQEIMLEALGIRSFADEMTTPDVLAAKKLIDPDGAGGTFQWLVQTDGVDLVEPWPQGHGTVVGPADPPAPWRHPSS